MPEALAAFQKVSVKLKENVGYCGRPTRDLYLKSKIAGIIITTRSKKMVCVLRETMIPQ